MKAKSHHVDQFGFWFTDLFPLGFLNAAVTVIHHITILWHNLDKDKAMLLSCLSKLVLLGDSGIGIHHPFIKY